MTENVLYPRLLESRLVEALADTPVVYIHGPRQCGKTTLAKLVGDRTGRRYYSLDEAATRAAVRADPVGFVADLPEYVTIDEVQRVPDLFLAIKAAVDRRRTPGRFLLTGSANLLLVPALSEALVGRMEVVRLHPLAQVELMRRSPDFLPSLFDDGFQMGAGHRLGSDLVRRIVAGGYPEPLQRSEEYRRTTWYTEYLDTLIQRDVKSLGRIRRLQSLPRLLTATASQTARLVNIAELAGPFQLSRPTVRDYVTLLGGLFLVDEIPPWHSNRLSRLIKSAKFHLGDTGLACALLEIAADGLAANRELLGQLLETFVYQELRRQASGMNWRLAFHHFRDRRQNEVDIEIERGARDLVGVEVKAAASVGEKDLRGLKKLRDVAGDRFRRGVLLYDGEMAVPMGDRLHAIPISRLWTRLGEESERE